MAPTTTTPQRRFTLLFTVRHYDVATWRYATGHPKSGQVSSVELYELVGKAQDWVYDNREQRVRCG